MEVVTVSYYCRTCGADVGTNKVCKNCECDTENGNEFCHYCGNATLPQAINCMKCHAQFGKPERSAHTTANNIKTGLKLQSNKWKVQLISVFVLIGVFLYFYEINRTEPKQHTEIPMSDVTKEQNTNTYSPEKPQAFSQPTESEPEMQGSTSSQKTNKPFNSSMYLNNSNGLVTVIFLVPDSGDPTRGTLYLGQGGCKFRFKYGLSAGFSSSGEEIKATFQSSDCGRSAQDRVFYYINLSDEFYTIIKGQKFYFERVGKAKVSEYDENGRVRYGHEDNLNQESLFDN